jgi:hypothetical protein
MPGKTLGRSVTIRFNVSSLPMRDTGCTSQAPSEPTANTSFDLFFKLSRCFRIAQARFRYMSNCAGETREMLPIINGHSFPRKCTGTPSSNSFETSDSDEKIASQEPMDELNTCSQLIDARTVEAMSC